MPQLIEFATHHLALIAAFFAVLGALLFTLRQGAGAISPAQAVQMLNKENALAVDIRPDEAFKGGHIINAVHVPGDQLADAAGTLQKYKDRPLVVYCEAGNASVQARQRLLKAGFTRVYSLQGGLTAWRSENLPLQ